MVHTLKEHLQAEGISAASCARDLNVAVSTVTRIVKGERQPSRELAAKIHKWSKGAVSMTVYGYVPQVAMR